MSANTIDSENMSKPAPDTAKPKGPRKAGKKAKPTKKEYRKDLDKFLSRHGSRRAKG